MASEADSGDTCRVFSANQCEGRGRWPLISPCGAVLLATCGAGVCCAAGDARWYLPVGLFCPKGFEDAAAGLLVWRRVVGGEGDDVLVVDHLFYLCCSFDRKI